ncbi:MAG: 4-hydroxythreonine-4-phosphate dehydrogenase PdxA [Bacteroidia bacterium]
MQENENKLTAGITIGDVNGIGLEIIIKTFLDPNMLQVCTPVIYGSSKVLSFHRKLLGIQEFNYSTIRNLNELNHKKVNHINCWEEEVKVDIGKSTPVGGKYALKSLQAGVKDLAEKKIDVLITAPIDKKSIQQEEFNFKGHTEFFANKFNAADYLMILVCDTLRVAFVTGHVPIKDIAVNINPDKIVAKLKTLNQSLRRDFAISKPRIAVLGLNPHAGDGGLIGKEEDEIITPAIKKTFDEGIMAYGPYPGDGFFGSSAYKKFDGILSMYHDQGLIPFKTLSFSSGVNYTAGLPVIRTSPDHGTAYDIAGKNKANENSFRQAIYLACDIYKNRKAFDEANANPLKFSKLGADR